MQRQATLLLWRVGRDEPRDVEADCRDRLHDLAPPIRRSLQQLPIDGTHVPVKEPSTASLADITPVVV